MLKIKTDTERLPKEFFKNIGSEWLVSPSIGDYVQGDTILVTQEEINAFYEATNELYDMFVVAGEHIVENDLFDEMGIDSKLVPMIKHSWENDNHWHLYGRFDLAGGLNGTPIKLLEFNADTATSIPECAVIQWAHLMHNELNEDKQFNSLYEKLVGQFTRLKELNPDKRPAILLTYMDDEEDKGNVEFIGEAALQAGFEIEYRDLPEIIFSDDEKEGGVWVQYGEDKFTKFDFWFKLLPWEFISEDEPELLETLTKIVVNEQCIVLNPAYTMMFQSKAIMKILWDLYPNHPLLLKTTYDKPETGAYVKKVIFGREGANIEIIGEDGEVIETKDGEYQDYKSIYQDYVNLPTDDNGNSYQAGMFFAYEGAGLCFRRGSKIINDTAQFVSHYIE